MVALEKAATHLKELRDLALAGLKSRGSLNRTVVKWESSRVEMSSLLLSSDKVFCNLVRILVVNNLDW